MQSELFARLFLCGSTGSPRTEKKSDPFTLSLSKGESSVFEIANQKGVSIVAVIAAMLILSVMGVTLISLVTTGSDVSINQLQSEQAFNIAAGGIEYTLAKNKSNIPNYSTNGTWIDLGEGKFKVDTLEYLTADPGVADTTISVNSTASFPLIGSILIDSELITYTGTNGTQFTGATRGAGGTTATTHTSGNSVYPAARITTTISAANCNTLPTIDVADDTLGFDINPPLNKYPFFIDNEYFLCDTKTQYQFQNCQRCYAGSSKEAHPSGGGNSFASQYILASTGRITNILSNDAQRVVRVSVGPKEE